MKLNDKEFNKNTNPFKLSESEFKKITGKAINNLIEQSKDKINKEKYEIKIISPERKELEEIVERFKGKYSIETIENFFIMMKNTSDCVMQVLIEYLNKNKIGPDLFHCFIPNLPYTLFSEIFYMLAKVIPENLMESFTEAQSEMIRNVAKDYYGKQDK